MRNRLVSAIQSRYGFGYIPVKPSRFAINRSVPSVLRRLEDGETVDDRLWEVF